MSFLDLIILFPELFLINFSLLFLWVGLYLRFKFVNNVFNYSFARYSVLLLFLTALLLVNGSFSCASAFLGVFIISGFETLLKLFILFVSGMIILSVSENEKNLSNTNIDIEINVLRLLVVVSMLLLIGVNDLIYLFLILELYALSSYILIGYRGTSSVFSGEAALKYFVVGTVFSIFMSYSLAIIYLITGLTAFNALEVYLSVSSTSAFVWAGYDIFYPAITLLLITFFFKLAAAPFHFWAPDVYEGAPTSTTYFLFVVPKIALLAIMIKLSFLWVNATPLNIMLFVAITSLIVGAVGGLFQKKIKRLLTYSMISNNGFFLLALVAGGLYGFSFMLFFLVIYTLSLLGLFTSLQTLRLYTTLNSIKNLWSWINLFFINRTQAMLTTLLLFSSAGIPPLVGFISKFFILLSLTTSLTNLHYLLVIVLVLSSLTCFYYIRVVKLMSFNKKKSWVFLRPLSPFSAYLISFMVMALFLLFLVSGFVLNVMILVFI